MLLLLLHVVVVVVVACCCCCCCMLLLLLLLHVVVVVACCCCCCCMLLLLLHVVVVVVVACCCCMLLLLPVVVVVACCCCCCGMLLLLLLTLLFYVIVKLFINEEKPHNIQEAIFRGGKIYPISKQSQIVRACLALTPWVYCVCSSPADLTELGIDYIDVVVLSIPPFLNADTQFSVIKPMWKVRFIYYYKTKIGQVAASMLQACHLTVVKPISGCVQLAPA